MATPSTVSATVHNCSYWVRLMLGNDHYVKVALWHVLHNTKRDPTYQGLSQDPSKLSKELKGYKIDLNRLKQKRVINKRQWQWLFPSDNKPCSKEFDVPLLAVLIQYCTTLPPPRGGWHYPDPTDVTSKAHYVLLACAFRNYLCHYSNPSTMLQPEFLIKWNEMEDIIKGLEYIVNTNDLKTGSLDPHCSTMLNYLQLKLADLFSQNEDMTNEIKNLKEQVKTEAENRQQEIDDAVKQTEEVFLKNKFDFGISLLARMKYEDAKRIFEELQHYDRTTGKFNSYTLKATLQIGVCSQLNGAYWDAMELFQEVLKQQKAVYGKSHSETLKTQQIIGECLIHQGKYFEAFCMLHETYEAQLKLFGLLHSDVLTTMHFIGVSLRKQGRYCDVDNKDQLQLNSQLLSETNYTDVENYTNAMSIFINVYNLRKELLGEKHPDTLITKRNIGICLVSQKKFSGAMDIYQNVYEHQSKIFGETHPDTIETRNQTDLCLREVCLNEVYSVSQKLFNKLRPINKWYCYLFT
ncbi:kinesin light chain 1-like [Hydractinia symbiolongicarpus]|uniref:kinesin light chain 1-like n=1 Tax=Hydractinia symbiolongicarpus TaxID=13093 RepID=UPI00254E33D6|nr:kinesin light chain 1-like [Hydractinia symbiolongicarpus]